MLTTIKDYIQKYKMIEENDTIIAGVSGGADSVCLLLVLLELQTQLKFDLVVQHINHKLRGEFSKRDEQFVEYLCKEKSVPYFCYSKNVATLAKEKNTSTELAGRQLRREVMEKLLKQYPKGKIALGHHLDDRVETGIINWARGTGILGLAGISPVKGEYIRPLLCVSKKQILEYLEQVNQKKVEDHTNYENIYTRNKVRNQVLPIITKSVNTKANLHMAQTQGELEEIYEFLVDHTKKAVTKVVKETKDGYTIAQELIQQYPDILIRGVIKEVLYEAAKVQQDVERIHILKVQELFTKQVGKRMDLPHQLVGRKTYGGIEIAKKEQNKNPKQREIDGVRLKVNGQTLQSKGELQEGVRLKVNGQTLQSKGELQEGVKLKVNGQTLQSKGELQEGVQLKVNGQTLLPNGKVIEGKVFEYNKVENIVDSHYTKYFDYDIIKDNLYIRCAKSQDKIQINSQGNHQSFIKFCKNNKVDAMKRMEMECIYSEEHILWILGYRKSMYAQVTQETKKIIRIQIGGY